MRKDQLARALLFIALLSLSHFSVSAETKPPSLNKQIISMDFKKIPVRELLQFIAEKLKLNVIMSESVTGNVSLSFRNISWEQALDTILEMSGFVKKLKDNVLFIATASEFASRQKSLMEAAPLKIVKVKLKHTDADAVNAMLKSQTDLLSPLAKIAVNSRDNSLWIKENVDSLPLLTNYLQQLDKPEAQLLITAKIINVDDKKINELGISFKQVPRESSLSQLHLSLPEHAASNLCMAIASFAQGQLLNLQLEALESAGFSKVIANPRVITQNRKTATIEAGEEIPYQESTSSGATSTAFKKAALSLKVTPILLPDGRITMELEINQNKTSTLSVNGTPAIQTQALKTEIIIRAGETVILGGILEKSNLEFINKIPVISQLPLVGSFFAQKGKRVLGKELLILVTPQLLKDS